MHRITKRKQQRRAADYAARAEQREAARRQTAMKLAALRGLDTAVQPATF